MGKISTLDVDEWHVVAPVLGVAIGAGIGLPGCRFVVAGPHAPCSALQHIAGLILGVFGWGTPSSVVSLAGWQPPATPRRLVHSARAAAVRRDLVVAGIRGPPNHLCGGGRRSVRRCRCRTCREG